MCVLHVKNMVRSVSRMTPEKMAEIQREALKRTNSLLDLNLAAKLEKHPGISQWLKVA